MVSNLSEEALETLRGDLGTSDEDFLYRRHDPFLKYLRKLSIADSLVVPSDVPHNPEKSSSGDWICLWLLDLIGLLVCVSMMKTHTRTSSLENLMPQIYEDVSIFSLLGYS